MKLHLIYFSAAGTIRKIIKAVAEGVLSKIDDAEPTTITKDDIAVFTTPLYECL